MKDYAGSVSNGVQYPKVMKEIKNKENMMQLVLHTAFI